MQKLTFFIAYEQSPHAGTLRPFLNWSKCLINYYEVNFVLFKCGNKLRDAIGNISGNVFETNNLQRAIQHLKKENIDWIIGDDYYPRLKLITTIKKTLNCKSVIYATVLFGFNSISRVASYSHLPLKSKIHLNVASLIPFKLLTNGYANTLKMHDFVIPVSKNVRTILQVLYGINSEKDIYPPLDINFYKNRYIEKSTADVLIYLGSNAGDTNGKFLEKIVELLIQKRYNVNIFGNAELMKQLATKFERVVLHSNVSNAEIVSLYSKNILTICPQKFEMFGYVPVESMSCGTPVLAFDMMGPGETIIDGKTGWLAKNEEQFLRKLKFILQGNYGEIDEGFIRERVINNFSMKMSTEKLLTTLETHNEI